MNRALEFKRRDNIYKGWIISKKYADILLNNKNSKNLHSILHSVYGEYLCDLKSNHLDNTNQKKYTFIPIIIILIGIVIGIFSILYSYYLTNNQREKLKWKYISGLVVLIFSSVAIYIIKYLKI